MTLKQQAPIIAALCNAYDNDKHIGDVANLFTREEITRLWPAARRVMLLCNPKPPVDPPMTAPEPVAPKPPKSPKTNRSKLYLMPK